MENEKRKNRKKIAIFYIIATILTIITGIIFILIRNDKILPADDYIIQRETDYSEKKGFLPIINLKGQKIDEINNEIISKYYSVALSDNDDFRYEYHIYKNILSLLITVTYYDDSEYGNIEYYSYNINLNDNKRLSNDELYYYLNTNSQEVNKIINNKIESYYKQDVLNQELSLDEYKEYIGYDKKNNKLVIKDDKLYLYYSFRVTQSLIEYQGNINEIEIKYLIK